MNETTNFTLFLIATLHQPQNEIKDWSLRNTLSIGSLTNILISWRYYIDPATINGYFSTKMQSYRYLARCFLVPGDLDCTWSVSDNITFIFIANLLSIKAIDWQYKMTPLVYEKVKNFDTYKVSSIRGVLTIENADMIVENAMGSVFTSVCTCCINRNWDELEGSMVHYDLICYCKYYYYI